MPCLLTDQNLANHFCKGSLKEHFYEFLFIRDEDFLKNLFMSVK